MKYLSSGPNMGRGARKVSGKMGGEARKSGKGRRIWRHRDFFGTQRVHLEYDAKKSRAFVPGQETVLICTAERLVLLRDGTEGFFGWLIVLKSI